MWTLKGKTQLSLVLQIVMVNESICAGPGTREFSALNKCPLLTHVSSSPVTQASCSHSPKPSPSAPCPHPLIAAEVPSFLLLEKSHRHLPCRPSSTTVCQYRPSPPGSLCTYTTLLQTSRCPPVFTCVTAALIRARVTCHPDCCSRLTATVAVSRLFTILGRSPRYHQKEPPKRQTCSGPKPPLLSCVHTVAMVISNPGPQMGTVPPTKARGQRGAVRGGIRW